MATKKLSYSGRALSQHLRDIAAEIHPEIEMVVNEDGEEEPRIVTKGEKLARYVFKNAIGWVERKTNDKGDEEVVVHQPQRWATEMVFDRLEGKAGQATEVEDTTRTVTGKVTELATKRNNAIVDDLLAAGQSK